MGSLPGDLDGELVELAPYAPPPGSAGAPLREMSWRIDAWTPDETDRLRAMFAAGDDLDTIAAAIGRGRQGVNYRIWELGLRRNSTRPWSDLEDAELARRYGGEPAARIAQDLGRAVTAVYCRANLLGVAREGEPDYDPWEIAQIEAGYAAAVPVGQIAALLGRPPSGVFTWAHRRGLRHPNAPADYAAEECARALELAHQGLPYREIIRILAEEGFPPRTKAGFGPKLRSLGYGRSWGRAWAAEEDDLIRAAYAAGRSLSTLIGPLGRTRWGISYRAGVLGLTGTHVNKAGFRQGPDWTVEEENILRAGYAAGRRAGDIAAEIGRGLRAVYSRANHLGLLHSWMRAYTAEEDRAIVLAWRHGVALADVANALARDPAVVSKRAIRMGHAFANPARPIKPPHTLRMSRRRPTLADILALGPDVRIVIPSPARRGRRPKTLEITTHG